MIAERRAYDHAKARCLNPQHSNYKDYGGRGIEFRFTSFEEFFAELGLRPKGLTLDRIENDGHYEKGNVRWSTRSEQSKNRRVTELMRQANRHSGSISGKKQVANGRFAKIMKKGQDKGRHSRWHTARGIVRASCEFCQEVAS